MSKKINKINKLKKMEGFVQINFLKGFKYVDKAGEFFNHFYKDNKFPPYAMDPTGMTAKINETTQLKVSPHHLWMHFYEPDSFDCQNKEFIKKATLVNSIFEPETYTRIGWRNYLAYECGDKYPNIIPEGYLDGSEFREIVFTKKINDLDSRISVSKLEKQGNIKNTILFDVDIFRKKDVESKEFSKMADYLKKIEEVYKSDQLLGVINDLLK